MKKGRRYKSAAFVFVPPFGLCIYLDDAEGVEGFVLKEELEAVGILEEFNA